MSSIAYVLVFVLCFWRNCWCFEQLEQFSLCSTGKRLENDQLLINDSLIAHDSLTKEPYINFMYDLKEPITYIEISANNNIYARVELNYDDTLIKGLITNIQPHNGNNNKLMPLEMIVQIFGFNVTVAESFNSNGVLKNNTTYMLVIAPIRKLRSLTSATIELFDDNNDDDDDDDDGDDVYDEEIEYNAADGAMKEDHEFEDNDEKDGNENDIKEHENDDETDENFFNQNLDKIIEMGQRQKGDYLLYENYQTSTEKTDQLSTHSVIFYYIDKNYITQVKFIIIDHFIENKLNGSAYKPPIVEYSHLSPTTLKAIITDRQTTSLFVQMLLYGYRPKDLPVDYVTFLPNAEKLKIYNSNNIDGDDERGIATEGPMSSMKRLKLFMNAENERQQQEQREQEQQYGLRQTSNGLVPTNDSPAEGNMKVLCWKPAEDKAATTTSHSLLVLNLIVIAITGTFMQLLFG
ncbi:protein PFC0760c [Glossina fuscipes]|uniref:Protein PFC0760c n=1 Tax=Glossina fuscipes TaxID=7396 RepID=A0A9C5ZC32_9MUSC|nr:protein PFC0760c [Glossina fuscipes]